MTDQDNPAPEATGLELFEQYDASGYLLLVTSDATALRLSPGDVIVRRLWATAAPAAIYNRARAGVA